MRVALEHELIRARAPTLAISPRQLGLNRIDVAAMIGRDLMTWGICLRRAGAERAKNLQRLAIQDVDDGSPSDVQKPLVWREGCRPRLKAILAVQTDKLLCDEFALGCEHLDPLVPAVGHIRQPIVRKLDVVRQ